MAPKEPTRALLRSKRLKRLRRSNDEPFTAGDRLILLVLFDHADDNGVSWPAQKTIADESGMQRSSVQERLPILIEEGVISVLEKGHQRKSTKYQIAPWLWTGGRASA